MSSQKVILLLLGSALLLSSQVAYHLAFPQYQIPRLEGSDGPHTGQAPPSSSRHLDSTHSGECLRAKLAAFRPPIHVQPFPIDPSGQTSPLTHSVCPAPDATLCAAKTRLIVSWFIVAPAGSELVKLWFDRLYCAVTTCPNLVTHIVHYSLFELSKSHLLVKNSLQALSNFTANTGKPGPHLLYVDYLAPTYMYKRPKLDWVAYEKYAMLTADAYATLRKPSLPIPRVIWMVWDQGVDDLIRNHTRDQHTGFSYLWGWQTLNPSWEVRLLDRENIKQWAPITAQVWNEDLPGRSKTQKSNMVRLEVLYRYGGVWADMSLLPMYPLDLWLHHELQVPGRTFLTYTFDPPIVDS